MFPTSCSDDSVCRIQRGKEGRKAITVTTFTAVVLHEVNINYTDVVDDSAILFMKFKIMLEFTSRKKKTKSIMSAKRNIRGPGSCVERSHKTIEMMAKRAAAKPYQGSTKS